MELLQRAYESLPPTAIPAPHRRLLDGTSETFDRADIRPVLTFEAPEGVAYLAVVGSHATPGNERCGVWGVFGLATDENGKARVIVCGDAVLASVAAERYSRLIRQLGGTPESLSGPDIEKALKTLLKTAG